MAKIVIIGAGLTGLSTAYHLEKNGYHDYAIFEKESAVGGLCRSTHQDGFTFDFTGHLIHTSDPYFRSFIHDVVGLEQLNSITRRSYIYSQQTYTRYPYQINLHGLPTKIIAECIEGYVKRKTSIRTPQSFKQWVLKHFGSGFAHHFFFPYQKKIFAYDINKLSASWTKNFVPHTSLEEIIAGTLQNKFDTGIGYNAQFFYPKKNGIFFWINKLTQQIHNPIHTNFCVDTIDMRTKTIYFSNGHEEQYDILVNTMPLDSLLRCIKEPASTTCNRALPYLRCNSVMNFNLGIVRPNLCQKNWIYFPESQYPFYRLGFPHTFATSMTPPGCSSLYGEFSYINKSPAWINKTLKQALHVTKKLLNIEKKEIITEKIIPISHAYVIYDFWREKKVPKLLARLKEYQLYSIGRYGAWKYASMQDAFLDGKTMAHILCIIPAKAEKKVQKPVSPIPQIQKEMI